jgi:hypothetical protein
MASPRRVNDPLAVYHLAAYHRLKRAASAYHRRVYRAGRISPIRISRIRVLRNLGKHLKAPFSKIYRLETSIDTRVGGSDFPQWVPPLSHWMQEKTNAWIFAEISTWVPPEKTPCSTIGYKGLCGRYWIYSARFASFVRRPAMPATAEPFGSNQGTTNK